MVLSLLLKQVKARILKRFEYRLSFAQRVIAKTYTIADIQPMPMKLKEQMIKMYGLDRSLLGDKAITEQNTKTIKSI